MPPVRTSQVRRRRPALWCAWRCGRSGDACSLLLNRSLSGLVARPTSVLFIACPASVNPVMIASFLLLPEQSASPGTGIKLMLELVLEPGLEPGLCSSRFESSASNARLIDSGLRQMMVSGAHRGVALRTIVRIEHFPAVPLGQHRCCRTGRCVTISAQSCFGGGLTGRGLQGLRLAGSRCDAVEAWWNLPWYNGVLYAGQFPSAVSVVPAGSYLAYLCSSPADTGSMVVDFPRIVLAVSGICEHR